MCENGNTRLHPRRFSSRYWLLTLLREQLIAIVNQHLTGRENIVIIDYGCGTMPYRPIFEEKAAKYIGIDLSPQSKQTPIFGIASLPDCFADVVLSTQVLEHVESPQEYLDECRRILKHNGLLILSTHGYWMYHPNPRDLWRWTGDGLRMLLRNHALNVVQFEGLMGLTATGLQLVQDGMIEKMPNLAKPIFALFMQTLIRICDAFESTLRKMEDACIFVAVAQKSPL